MAALMKGDLLSCTDRQLILGKQEDKDHYVKVIIHCDKYSSLQYILFLTVYYLKSPI